MSPSIVDRVGRPGRGGPHCAAAIACAAAALLLSRSGFAQVITLLPPTVDARAFGRSVSAVPDVDGDGRSDFVVGCDEPIGGVGSTGRAHLYSGATGVLLRSFSPPHPGTEIFAACVRGIGDLDGDERGDVLVSSHLERLPGQEGFATGVAYVFSGATGAIIHTLTPPPGTAANFSAALAAVPDADGDGIPDILVGAPWASNGGWAFLYSGASGQLLHSFVSANPQVNARFGSWVAGVPDLDGDGRGDVLVGASRETWVGGNDGRVYVFSGATGALLHILEAPDPAYALFGMEVAGVADLDGDGRGDILVGAWNALTPELPEVRGRAFVYSGATGQLLYTLLPPFTDYSFAWGAHIGVLPDLDGDGRPELLISGALMMVGDPAVSAGVVDIFSGATGRLLRSMSSPNPQQAGFFGRTLAGAPVASGSRRADILIGAQGERTPAIQTGAVYAFAACRADANADGRIDSRDISHFITGWIATVASPPGTLPPPGVHHGDFNDSGTVDSTDIADFIGQWLQTIAAGGC